MRQKRHGVKKARFADAQLIADVVPASCAIAHRTSGPIPRDLSIYKKLFDDLS
jgi:hypothetical protein